MRCTNSRFHGKTAALALLLCAGSWAGEGALAGVPHGKIKNEVTSTRRTGWDTCERVQKGWRYVEAESVITDLRVRFKTKGKVEQGVKHIRWDNKVAVGLRNVWRSAQPWGIRVYVKIKGDLTVTPYARAPRPGAGVPGRPPAVPKWETNSIDLDLDADADRTGPLTGTDREDQAEDVGPGAVVVVNGVGPLKLRQILPDDRPRGTVTLERSRTDLVDVGFKKPDGSWNRSVFAKPQDRTAQIPWNNVAAKDLDLLVKGLKPGAVTLTARYWNADQYWLFEDPVHFTVLKDTDKLQIVPDIDFMLPGQKLRFSAFLKRRGKFQNVAVTWTIAANGRAVMTPDDRRRHKYVDVEAKQVSSAVDDVVLTIPRRRRRPKVEEKFSVLGLAFIDDSSKSIPQPGKTARLRISKVVTNRLTNTAAAGTFPRAAVTFDGPETKDPDVFRVEIQGIPAGNAANISVRIDVFRAEGTVRNSNTYEVIEDMIGGKPAYRINEQLRLVSNATDDAVAAAGREPTLLAEIGDRVRATLVWKGNATGGYTELPVNRPAIEDGPDAIRTVDVVVHLVHPLQPRQININRLRQWMRQWLNEDWAQAGIRYRLIVAPGVITPVNNIFQLSGKATAAGNITVMVEGRNYQVAVNRGDTARTVARNLKLKMDAVARFATAINHGKDDAWIVINRGAAREPAMQQVGAAPNGITLTRPDVSLGNDDTTLDTEELHALGYNHNRDGDIRESVDLFIVNELKIEAPGQLGGTVHWDIGQWGKAYDSAFNCIFISSFNYGAAVNSHLDAHEMCHVHFNVGNAGHLATPPPENRFNLFFFPLKGRPHVEDTKRLLKTQQEKSRNVPAPRPQILKKR